MGKLTLPHAGVILLAGPNNSGKSALLSAFDIIAGRGVASLVRHAAATQSATLRARFSLTEDQRSRILPDSDALLRVDALAWVDWHFAEHPEGQMQLVELRSRWERDVPEIPLAKVVVEGENSKFIVNESLLPLLRGEATPGEIRSRIEEYNPRRTQQGGVLSLVGTLDYVPELAAFIDMWNEWREQYYHFQALRTGTNWSYRLSSQPVMAPTGENLPAVLVDLQHNRPEHWERVRQLIEQTVPEVGVLETPTREQEVHVAFRDPHVTGYRPNIKSLGTGVEQLLMTIVVGVTQSPPSVIVIEEPETNLHPGGQRALLGHA
jgi:predicted ATPase